MLPATTYGTKDYRTAAIHFGVELVLEDLQIPLELFGQAGHLRDERSTNAQALSVQPPFDDESPQGRQFSPYVLVVQFASYRKKTSGHEQEQP